MKINNSRNKVKSYMGFAKRSGNLVSGADTCIINMKKQKVKLLIIAEDISENSMDKMVSAAAAGGIQYRVYGTGEELSKAVGTSGKMTFGILEKGFADSIAREIDQESQDERRGSYDSEDR